MAVRSGSLWLSIRVKLKNEKGCSLEPIEEQAAIVRMIFDLYTVGLQADRGWFRSPVCLVGSIATRLNDMHIPTRLNDMHIPSPSGSQWARITIRGIIKNPTYIGMVRWGSRETKKKVVDGKVVSVRGPRRPRERVHIQRHSPSAHSESKHLSSQTISSTRSENTSTHKEKVVRESSGRSARLLRVRQADDADDKPCPSRYAGRALPSSRLPELL